MENLNELNDLLYQSTLAKSALNQAGYMHIDTQSTINARLINMLIGTEKLKSIFWDFKQSLINEINARKKDIDNELAKYSVTKND
jgi:hypothetical protein